MTTLHAGNADRDAFIKYAKLISEVLPSSDAGSRFSRLFDIAKKSKLHDYFILAGPLGAYMLHMAKDIKEDQRTAMTLILQACGDLWEKVIYM